MTIHELRQQMIAWFMISTLTACSAFDWLIAWFVICVGKSALYVMVSVFWFWLVRGSGLHIQIYNQYIVWHNELLMYDSETLSISCYHWWIVRWMVWLVDILEIIFGNDGWWFASNDGSIHRCNLYVEFANRLSNWVPLNHNILRAQDAILYVHDGSCCSTIRNSQQSVRWCNIGSSQITSADTSQNMLSKIVVGVGLIHNFVPSGSARMPWLTERWAIITTGGVDGVSPTTAYPLNWWWSTIGFTLRFQS